MSEKAILFGPFVGEFYWEAARFAPVFQNFRHETYKNKKIKFIVLTREERFDLYGSAADILVPLRIPGDYESLQPNCFKLNGFKLDDYMDLALKFRRKYREKYEIVTHLFPRIKKPSFMNKNQFLGRYGYLYNYQPRKENYTLVNDYLSEANKPLIVLAPRYRKGFKRNWHRWPEFYYMIWKDKELWRDFNFIICGKPGEYVPEEKGRFYDMSHIALTNNSSIAGLLLVILERAFFTVGSQSAIPNLSLLHGVEVLEFGCQKALHTKSYNVKKTPITFIENKKYDIHPKELFKVFKQRLYQKLKEKN